MLKKDVFEIFIKTLCIYFFINSIQIFTVLVDSTFFNTKTLPIMFLALNSIIYLLVAITLWFSSPFLSTKLTKDPNQIITSDLTKGNLQYVVFSSIGLYLVVFNLPKVLGFILIKIYQDPTYKALYNIDLMKNILHILIGIALMLGANRIIILLNKIQTLGDKSKNL